MLFPPGPRSEAAAWRDLDSSNHGVRAEAIGDVIRHAAHQLEQRPRLVAALERLLVDESAHVRATAAMGLGEVQGHEALPRLLMAVDDDDEQVRQMALRALGDVADPRAVPRLTRALRDDRAEVRYQGIIALGKVCQDIPLVEGALGQAMADADPAVRYMAVRVAEECAVRWDRLLGEGLRHHVRERLRDDHVDVVAAAAVLLVGQGEASSLELLAEIVRTGKLHGRAVPVEEEQAAVELCGLAGQSDLIPHFERRAFGLARFVRETCPWQALASLARLGHSRATERLKRALRSQKPMDVQSAVYIIGRLRLTMFAEDLERLSVDEVDDELRREALGHLERERRPSTVGEGPSRGLGTMGSR